MNKAPETARQEHYSLHDEMNNIAAAIRTTRFMDPPDGGDVSLSEQVLRMRQALETAEQKLAAIAALLETQA